LRDDAAMKPPAFEYHRPATVEEALAVLAEVGHDGKVLAGGQSLVPLLNMRLAATVRHEVMRS
jgi:carbon-monoxide dehydrogenase medium subunit